VDTSVSHAFLSSNNHNGLISAFFKKGSFSKRCMLV
jgi:hypothetical protein